MTGRSCKSRRCVFFGDETDTFFFSSRRPPSAPLQSTSSLAQPQSSVVVDIRGEPHGSAQVKFDALAR